MKLTIDGEEFTQKLVVKKDPHSAGSDVDIKAQMKVLLEIRDNINTVADMINQIELIRKQLYDLKALLEGDESSEEVITAGEELDKKLIAFEDNLFCLGLTGSGDGLHWRDKFYVKLGSLASGIGNSDFPPTTQQVEVHQKLQKELATCQNRFSEQLNKDLPAFNNMLKEKNITNIIARTP